MLVDSHCHLDYLAGDGDLDAVIGRARAAGVGYMQTISTRLDEFDAVAAIAAAHDDIGCSVGVHPHNVADDRPPATLERLAALAEAPDVIGIGETGLDFYYEHSPRDAQAASFRTHIRAARETGLPLIVHTRDADAATIGILREEAEQGAYPGLIHCFSASAELAQAALDLGLFISLSGIVTFKNAGAVRAVARAVPPERLLIETDAPYLAPVPKRGRRNEPAFVAHTAAFLAELLDSDTTTLAARTSENFFRLFAKARRPDA